jgi:hypothetical protein
VVEGDLVASRKAEDIDCRQRLGHTEHIGLSCRVPWVQEEERSGRLSNRNGQDCDKLQCRKLVTRAGCYSNTESGGCSLPVCRGVRLRQG